VGKALLAPCPPFFESTVFALMVGTQPDAFATRGFAHPVSFWSFGASLQ
jgi:hypothetical protein